MSSRMPTFCMLVSSISLMAVLGLVAYDAGPVGVLIIAALVVLVMFLQFIAYGTRRLLTSSFHIWKAVTDLTFNAVRGFQGLDSQG